MKMRLVLLLTLFSQLLTQLAFTQPICGFDGMHQRAMKEDPVYRQQVLEGEAAARKYILQHPELSQPRTPRALLSDKAGSSPVTLGTALYTIPVVVHIIHTGGAIGSTYNPTDAQIQGAIAYLNAVYNGSWPGTTGAGDLQIQFALAQRDPNCNPTTGITRLDGSSLAGYAAGGVNVNTTGGASELDVKNLIRWDPTQYYNVWVVDKIDGNDGTAGQFIAGFAYLPGAPTSYDGIIMLATQMISGQKTLPHEIGHAFDLYHPFQGSSDSTQCPLNADCTAQGDSVCDTDPISYHASASGVVNFTCRTGINPCTGTPYNDSTESNYMNYTFCYHLFTGGQKARMLAAAAGSYRAGLTTSQGAFAPNAGSSPCLPKINFQTTGDQLTETTAATAGCRAYKDYTYDMVIGAGPSASAIATLSVISGTAVQGLDFDLTTNGSFTSPSQTLTFPAGTATSQPFTIRVYDDASVNGARDLILGFTVNNGGGNALAGTGITTFTLNIADNDTAPSDGAASGSTTLGSNAANTTTTPFDNTQATQRSQFLYKASELTAAGIPAGPLTGISFRVLTKNSTRAFTNMKINIGTATAGYLVDNGTLTLGANMTTVKSMASFTTAAGWNNIPFDANYTWDGTSNLVVEICCDNGSALSTAGSDLMAFYFDGGSSNQANTIYQDGVTCAQSYTTVNWFASGAKPEIKFNYGLPATAIESTLNASIQQYLGPNADLYFYDQTNGQLMARIQNLSAFNYGCTQVLVDRNGIGASPFWSSNTSSYLMNKTFKVIPTTNNASGDYNITIYYTQPEVNGWQSATGQNLSNIQIIKTSGKISDVTPSTPDGGGAVILTGTPAISSLGSNTGLTYHFSNGFSGFGAGIPGFSPLPITLQDFTARLQNGYTLLNWSTSLESDSKRFGIDRSYDGSSFSNIGYVDATGRNNSRYSFTDPSPAQKINYYRLQEIDQDDHFTYSNTLVVSQNAGNGLFTLSPSPFTNSLDIHFTTASAVPVTVRLLDITGKALFKTTAEQNTGGFVHTDLSGLNLSAGIYLLEITYNNQLYTEKVLKK